ncbi:unnamed protein product [Rhizophagus irregularis]|nr:unnamed protein product [Rhizophagus irregularis]
MESEIDLLRQENARLVAKNYELEAEIVKLSQIIEENARRDVRVKELEQKNTELEARLASLEQASLIVDRQPQNDNEMISEGLPEVSVPAVSISEFVVDQQNNVDTKSTEDKIIDDCLLKQTPMSEVLPEITDVHDVCRKQTQLEQCKPDSKTNNMVPEVSVSTSPPFCEEDRETDEFLNAVYKKKVGDEIRQRKREKKLQDNSSPEVTFQREPDSETLVTSLDSAILLNEKNGQGCSSFPQSEISRDKKNTLVSENSNNSPSTKSCNASSSFECDEKAYEDRVRDVKSKNGIDDKSARTLVYSEIKPLLPDITDVNLRKITFRAKKIYILFDGIGINRIQIISCSASAISNLSDNQIQDIINDFHPKATNTDDVDYDDSVPNWNGHVTSKTNKTAVPKRI